MTVTAEKRRVVSVINPAAGRGKYLPKAREEAEFHKVDALHLTEGVGECTDYIEKTCLTDPHTHFVVYGGDGTAGEAATGIMRAGAGETARLTVIPAGSGNDFIRGMKQIPLPAGQDSLPLDLIWVNDRYVLNVLNMGFDCDVVEASESMRRSTHIPGGLSYALGVAEVLMKKAVFSATVRLTDVWQPDGSLLPEETFEGDFLLTAIGNMPFYGGGFKALPAALPTDGFSDVVLVKDVTRLQFVSLVGGYKSGSYINPDTLQPLPKFEKFLHYRRCRAISLSGVSRICLDGEIIPASGLRAQVIPAAIRYVPNLW